MVWERVTTATHLLTRKHRALVIEHLWEQVVSSPLWTWLSCQMAKYLPFDWTSQVWQDFAISAVDTRAASKVETLVAAGWSPEDLLPSTTWNTWMLATASPSCVEALSMLETVCPTPCRLAVLSSCLAQACLSQQTRAIAWWEARGACLIERDCALLSLHLRSYIDSLGRKAASTT